MRGATGERERNEIVCFLSVTTENKKIFVHSSIFMLSREKKLNVLDRQA